MSKDKDKLNKGKKEGGSVGSYLSSVRDRVGELVRIPASQIAGAPWNWRSHPKRQEAAVVASLEELGIYSPLLGRQLDDGTVELIDGHLRRTIFQRVGPDTLVPIVLCDLDEMEAKKANLLHDPLAGLAEVDREKLDGLLREVQTGSEDLAGVLDELAKNAGLVEKGKSDLETRTDDQPNTQYLIHVVCESEEHQAEVIEEITKMGLECKALIF